MSDARFEDGGEAPLRLIALAPEDLPVISALVQDAVFPASEMRHDRRRREFAILLNRFRWEDRETAERMGRGYERVQSVLLFRDVMAVGVQGLSGRSADTVLSLLALEFHAGEDGTGAVVLTLAGDGALRLSLECLDVTLHDMTRPYLAPSRRVPEHPAE